MAKEKNSLILAGELVNKVKAIRAAAKAKEEALLASFPEDVRELALDSLEDE